MFKNVSFIHGPENIYRYLIGTKLFISSAGISMFEASNLKKPGFCSGIMKIKIYLMIVMKI